MVPALMCAAQESVYGDATAPTGSDAFLVQNISQPKPIEERREDNSVSQFAGGKPALANVPIGWEFSFEMRLKGASAAGVAPRQGRFIRASSFAEAIIPAVSVTYTLIDLKDAKLADSLCIYFYWNGKLHKMPGARGKVSFVANVNDFVIAKFVMQSKYLAPISGALPTPSYDTIKEELFRNASLSINSDSSYVLPGLEIDVAAELTREDNVNAVDGVEMFYHKDRKTTVKVSPEVTASKDFWDIWANGTLVPLTAQWGTPGGRQFQFNLPNIQKTTAPVNNERDGLGVQDLQFQAYHTASGNDEFSLTCL